MYASKMVEHASVKELFGNPMHPYTQGLFNSIPTLGQTKEKRLDVIPGTVPNPLFFPPGCKFHPRCSKAIERCKTVEPELTELAKGHDVSCDVVAEEITNQESRITN